MVGDQLNGSFHLIEFVDIKIANITRAVGTAAQLPNREDQLLLGSDWQGSPGCPRKPVNHLCLEALCHYRFH